MPTKAVLALSFSLIPAPPAWAGAAARRQWNRNRTLPAPEKIGIPASAH